MGIFRTVSKTQSIGAFIGVFSLLVAPESSQSKVISCARSLESMIRSESIRLNEKRVAEMLTTLEEAKSLLGNQLRPPVVSIDLKASSQDAYMDPVGDLDTSKPILSLPYQYGRDDEALIRFDKAVITHEYFHAVFDENIGDFSKASELLAQSNKGIHSLMMVASRANAIARLVERRLNDERLTPRQREGYKTVMSKIETKVLSLYKRFSPSDPTALKFRSVLSASSELYSDVAAVLVFSDGKVISDALELALKPTSLEEKQNIADRDFTIPRKVDEWVRNADASALNDPHRVLAPVRSFLWEYYLSRPDARARSPEILNGLLKSMGEYADLWLQNKGPDPINFSKSAAEFNATLIEVIRKNFDQK